MVNFFTWNCRGLNGTVKRGNILAHLEKLGMDVGDCFRGDEEHKVSLFTDDLLIHISDPLKSLPAIISI